MLLMLAGCGGAYQAIPIGPPTAAINTTPVCYECFWTHQDAALRSELVRTYKQRAPSDPLVRAEMHLLLARVERDSSALCAAAREFEELSRVESEPARRLLAIETFAFSAAACGVSPQPQFERAAAAARDAQQPRKAATYQQIATGTFRPRLEEKPAAGTLKAPPQTRAYVLGKSAIRVSSGDTVVTQMERIVRDWISYQLGYDFRPRSLRATELLDYHEGARLRDIMAGANVQVAPSSGELLVNLGGRWFAADETGVFRFEVLPDKVQYPTTRSWNGIALLVDTHGISSLVEPALRHGARLVIGCGDYTGKMQAAAYLAGKGVNVYYPTDRFASEVLGYTGDGVLLGSAPVRQEAGVAVIGDRPVTFRVDETIVVQRISARGVLQYYDAPGRYFQRLNEALPLRTDYVEVDAPGQSARVIDRARQVGAKAIALRVWTEEDYAPVRDWLAQSPEHRAVLFHTVAYPPGDRLFAEFPGQTTFGDARPLFLN